MKKQCSKCRNEKDLVEFTKSKTGKHGTESQCKVCRKKSRNYENRRQYSREWNKNNKNKVAVRKRATHIYRMKNDMLYRLKHRLRTRLASAISNNQKSGSAVSDLGCTIIELKQYLENQFIEGMSWNNHSREGWHIDHIQPLSSFNLADPEELKKAVHYTNLQPLWAKDNWSKSNKRPIE